MATLSRAGEQLVQDVSRRYGLSADAVTHMLMAVYRGQGSMAQFSHPELGGSGQWMRGGMTMVGDMFNHQLKMLVDNLCNDLSNGLANFQSTPFSGSFQSQSQSGFDAQSQAAGQIGSANGLFVPDPSAQWWPPELGVPSAIGSQNNVKYAYFPALRRLAVATGGVPWVYDTQDHSIGGFGQQQGGDSSITFTSQYGTVRLSSLPVVMRAGVPVQQEPAQEAPMQAPLPPSAPLASPPAMPSPIDPPVAVEAAPAPAAPPKASSEDVIALLEKLGQLMEKGYVSKEEFASKKAELLARL